MLLLAVTAISTMAALRINAAPECRRNAALAERRAREEREALRRVRSD